LFAFTALVVTHHLCLISPHSHLKIRLSYTSVRLFALDYLTGGVKRALLSVSYDLCFLTAVIEIKQQAPVLSLVDETT